MTHHNKLKSLIKYFCVEVYINIEETYQEYIEYEMTTFIFIRGSSHSHTHTQTHIYVEKVACNKTFFFFFVTEKRISLKQPKVKDYYISLI